jgi:hypothetical protein
LGLLFQKKQLHLLETLAVFAHPASAEAIATISEVANWRSSSQALSRVSLIEFMDGRYVLHPVVRAHFGQRIDPEQVRALEQRMVQYFLAYTSEHRDDFDQLNRLLKNSIYDAR